MQQRLHLTKIKTVYEMRSEQDNSLIAYLEHKEELAG